MPRKGQLGTGQWEERIWDPTELDSTFYISGTFWLPDPGQVT